MGAGERAPEADEGGDRRTGARDGCEGAEERGRGRTLEGAEVGARARSGEHEVGGGGGAEGVGT
ncbi:hypothetical protein C7M71_024760 [Peterkaempfera bronchialis]|uniref:Uncharacterized protein n=1 Tax=Peterkaempfera bronchialis TaxID=2126346 RepID=A0A345T2C6_9ACTN|nr:hypothetical protein C7M71_024760 [Peterkaempfera bronchialis]